MFILAFVGRVGSLRFAGLVPDVTSRIVVARTSSEARQGRILSRELSARHRVAARSVRPSSDAQSDVSSRACGEHARHEQHTGVGIRVEESGGP